MQRPLAEHRDLNVFLISVAEIRTSTQATAPTRKHGDRQLVMVLFTDIVGSTKRTEALGDESWRALLETHNSLENGGGIIPQ